MPISDEIAGGFGGGFANSLNEMLKSKMQLAILSKRIEMESQARMAEQANANQLNRVPGEQVASLAGMMGATGDTSGLNGMSIPGSLAGSALQGIGFGNRIPQFQTVDAGVDQFGNKQGRIFNRKTGQWETPATPTGGMANTAAEDVAKTKQSAQEMRGIINLVDSQTKQLSTAAGASDLPEQAARNKIAQYLQNDAGAMKAYKDTIASHNARFEYALSHNPRLAAQIQTTASGQWFDPIFDTQSTWGKKKANLLNLVQNSENAGLQAHGIQPQASNGLGPLNNASDPFADLRGK